MKNEQEKNETTINEVKTHLKNATFELVESVSTLLKHQMNKAIDKFGTKKEEEDKSD